MRTGVTLVVVMALLASVLALTTSETGPPVIFGAAGETATATPTPQPDTATPTPQPDTATPTPADTGTATPTVTPLPGTATPNSAGSGINNPVAPRFTPTVDAPPPASDVELPQAPVSDQGDLLLDRGGSLGPADEQANIGPASLSLPTAGSYQEVENAPRPVAALAALIGVAGALMMTMGARRISKKSADSSY